MNIYGDLGDYECDKCGETGCKYKSVNPPFICSVCGMEITRRQYVESDRRIGNPVCAQCECEYDKSQKTCLAQRIKAGWERIKKHE